MENINVNGCLSFDKRLDKKICGYILEQASIIKGTGYFAKHPYLMPAI